MTASTPMDMMAADLIRTMTEVILQEGCSNAFAMA